MAATLDIISNQINNVYNYLTTNLTANQLNLINEIKNDTTKTFLDVRSDLNFINAAISANVNNTQANLTNAINGVYNLVNTNTNKLSVDLQAKMNAVNSSIQSKIDGSALLIQQKLDAINEDVKQTIYNGIHYVLEDVDKRAGEVTASVVNLIQDLTAVNKATATQTQNLLKETTGQLNNQLSNEIAKIPNGTDTIITAIKKANIEIQNAIAATATQVVTTKPNTPSKDLDLLTQLFNTIFGSPVSAQDNNSDTLGDKLKPKLIYSGGTINGGVPVDFTGLAGLGQSLSNQVHQITTIIDKATRGEYTTLDAFETDFRKLGVNTDLVNGVLQLLFIIPSMLNIGKTKTDVFNTRIQRLNQEKYDLTQVDATALVEEYKRGIINREKAFSGIKALGYSDIDANNFLELKDYLMAVTELKRGVIRGAYTDDYARALAAKLGVSSEQWLAYGKILQVRPSVNDFIQFAVKEVYTKELTDKFGQYEEFPQEFANQAKLEGLGEEHAKQYWAAHWNLPSATMGYEMLHRGIINQADLKSLLKALDVMPFWREKLIALSYSNVTRVDARRLHAYNLYSDNDLLNAYRRLGYNETDAQKLVQFANYVEDEQENPKKKKLKDLTYNTLLTAYRRGILSRSDTINQIMPLGYSREEVELLLKLEDYQIYIDTHKSKKDEHNSKLATMAINAYNKKSIPESSLLEYLKQAGYSEPDAKQEVELAKAEYAIAFKAEIARGVQRMYMEGLYEDNDVLSSLQSLNFMPTEAANILNEMKVLDTFNTKKPTMAQFTKLYNQGVISEDKYKEIVIEEGYADEYVPYMLALAGIEVND